jgi:Mg2+/Co2+ transporter CorC
LESIIGPVEDEFDDEQPEIIKEGAKQFKVIIKDLAQDLRDIWQPDRKSYHFYCYI